MVQLDNSTKGKSFSDVLYCNFHRDYVLMKAMTCKSLLDNFDAVCKHVKRCGALSVSDQESQKAMLLAELHFCKYHALETMFAVMFCIINNDEDLWGGLARYSFRDFNKKIEKLLSGGIGSLSEKSDEETLRTIFFKNCDYEKICPEKLSNNIKAIKEIIYYAAKEINDKDEYNAYKHGLRFLKGRAKIILSGKDNQYSNELVESHLNLFLNRDKKLRARIIDGNRSFEIVRVTYDLTKFMLNLRAVEQNVPGHYDVELRDFSNVDIKKDIFWDSPISSEVLDEFVDRDLLAVNIDMPDNNANDKAKKTNSQVKPGNII